MLKSWNVVITYQKSKGGGGSGGGEGGMGDESTEFYKREI
jgi:hypothetical protein